VVATIDLDYFSGMDPAAQAIAFERVWAFVAGLRNLRAVTIAVSRPYLTGDAEAHRLLQLALKAAFSLPTATIEFEPFEIVGNDQSLLARKLRAQGKQVPAYDLTGAPAELRALILANRDRLTVCAEAKKWDALLRRWSSEAPQFRLELSEGAPSTDGVWRVPASQAFQVQLRSEPSDLTPGKVEWIALTPAFNNCNLTAKSADEGPFATGAPPRPRWRECSLNASGTTLDSAALKPFFDANSGCGVVRVKARVLGGDWLRETPVLEVRRFSGTGFRAALTEQFGLPYLFGSGFLQNGADTGPETGWGADCANFIVYALRRQGRSVPWSDPKQLRAYLQPMASPAILGETKFTKEDLKAGLLVHFGTHVAALMEDRPPLGVLDDCDLVAHQLEGAPEVVPLLKLLERRKGMPFDLLRVPSFRPDARILIGGDVMLARSVGQAVKVGTDPFAGIRSLWERASLRGGNLECVISDKGSPMPGKPFVFRAPLEAASALRSAKVDAVSLANNHSGDCGGAALRDCVARLQKEHVVPIGPNGAKSRTTPVSFFALAGDRKLAVLALNALEETKSAVAGQAGFVDGFSRETLLSAIQQARSRAELLVCLVHWGEENSARITDEQRSLARWLIDHGIDVVAGSHPHCVQPLDFYHGHPIAYSLGNLVFDGAPGLDAWNRGALLEIELSRGVPYPEVRLVPVHLDRSGLPQSD
jgi:hypothetical protein